LTPLLRLSVSSPIPSLPIIGDERTYSTTTSVTRRTRTHPGPNGTAAWPSRRQATAVQTHRRWFQPKSNVYGGGADG
jgi:hypothetical protein